MPARPALLGQVRIISHRDTCATGEADYSVFGEPQLYATEGGREEVTSLQAQLLVVISVQT